MSVSTGLLIDPTKPAAIYKIPGLERLAPPAGFCNWDDIPARIHAMATPEKTLCGCHIPHKLRGIVPMIARWETLPADSRHLCRRCLSAIRKTARLQAVSAYRELSAR